MIHYDRLTRSGHLTNTPSFLNSAIVVHVHVHCMSCAYALWKGHPQVLIRVNKSRVHPLDGFKDAVPSSSPHPILSVRLVPVLLRLSLISHPIIASITSTQPLFWYSVPCYLRLPFLPPLHIAASPSCLSFTFETQILYFHQALLSPTGLLSYSQATDSIQWITPSLSAS